MSCVTQALTDFIDAQIATKQAEIAQLQALRAQLANCNQGFTNYNEGTYTSETYGE